MNRIQAALSIFYFCTAITIIFYYLFFARIIDRYLLVGSLNVTFLFLFLTAITIIFNDLFFSGLSIGTFL
jgi:hypothetical protein